ncbi:hypothetical protein TTHERM_001542772 (macronuclear) [Tetrahymena thermophila SB210]|uniref:Uncharacterized protein n=1 Tax=Tetrahymena thermophila (strain SB210) TaxID=312017 RepID=W7XFQ9_TETTS|nr:hypothetical protein TTHERM_001542772 [Tetrahymena thermophila SB210]EWS76707.1 hypothetical protein TTHERM_001542772 [Tetrahymena thermophila SB210]|eukprot:XP_012650759.1 hypothetical protein TTHERM_001542772 [Tetrahymena thermophila SB210]
MNNQIFIYLFINSTHKKLNIKIVQSIYFLLFNSMLGKCYWLNITDQLSLKQTIKIFYILWFVFYMLETRQNKTDFFVYYQKDNKHRSEAMQRFVLLPTFEQFRLI